jgi:sugar phosphate isomerase/epimerase
MADKMILDTPHLTLTTFLIPYNNKTTYMSNNPGYFNRRLLLLIICFIYLVPLDNILYGQRINDLPSRIKISLNAYSFNQPLSRGSMNIEDLLYYCANAGFDAVDITAYYFPGYPQVPSDEYLYHIKKTAFLMGLEISGTGVRNEFAHPDPVIRRESVELVKEWIIAAEKLGAPVIRIFAGHANTDGYSREQVLEWMVKDIKECIEFGKNHGVVVAIQNHNDFLKTADQAVEIMELLDSDWTGIILDTGSFRSGNSYAQIETTIPYAVNWQIKSKTYMHGVEENIDLERLMNIIRKSGYRGYVPIETLEPGDPVPHVNKLLADVKAAINKVYGQ